MIYKIDKESSGKTVEQYLRQKSFTKNEISRMKFTGAGIQCNGVQCRVNYILEEDDCLSINFIQEKRNSCEWVPVPLQTEILYEDDYLIALDKPAGMVVHPAGGHYMDTLANQVAGYYKEKGVSYAIRPVGRLDKDVSGVVIFAKDQITAARLASERERQSFTKEYVALTEGIFQEQELTIRGKIQVLPSGYSAEISENGKPAETMVSVMKRIGDEEETLVRCTIRHGRMHQIRIHLSSIGHPILGDQMYGSRRSFNGRIALHAERASFLHPFLDRVIKIESHQKILIDSQKYHMSLL